jgi:solute carrier family 13 (sodium-dependent dicarboxylate transporter), member 2/3/5
MTFATGPARGHENVLGISLSRFAAPAAALTLTAAIWFAPADLTDRGRLALIIFYLAVLGWTFTRINDTTVALTAGISLVVTGVVASDRLYEALSHDLIWLLLAAFLISAVLRETGITRRVVAVAIQPARTIAHLFYLLTFAIIATAFVIPSTTGRAIVLLPVFLALADAIDDARIARALAMLFPSVILLSACASLIGAGAHVVAVDFISSQPKGQTIDYLRWMKLGLPLALVSSFAATLAILHGFLTAVERRRAVKLLRLARNGTPAREIAIGAIILVTVILWMTMRLHGIGMALVGLAAAVLLTLPSISGVTLKTAVRSVEWELILFLAATIVIGDALMDSGAVSWLAGKLVQGIPANLTLSPLFVVSVVATVSLLAHLLIVSRTARATVLIPAVGLPMAGFGYDPAAVIFLTATATGFCQTLMVSAKSVAVYGKLEQPTYSAGDLMKLSMILMPVLFVVLLIMSLYIWPLLGLPLVGRAT